MTDEGRLRASCLVAGVAGPLETLGKMLLGAFVDDGGKQATGQGYADDEPTPAELCELAAWMIGRAVSDLREVERLTE